MIRFWLGMNHRGAVKRNDKLLIGNIDTQEAVYIDVSEILTALSADDLAEGANNKYITALERQKLASIAGDLLTLQSAAANFYPLNANPAGYLNTESTIAAAKITGALAAAQIPNLDADKIVSGLFSAARIPDLDASKITSGTLHLDRIPQIPASKLEAISLELGNYLLKAAIGAANGVTPLDANVKVPVGYIPNFDASKITTGTIAEERLPSGFLKSSDVVDNLSSTSTTLPASANQVRKLNELINELSGSTPTFTGLESFKYNWQGGLRITPEAVWYKEGSKESFTGELFHPAADANFDRRDLIYIDLVAADIKIRPGDPSANPAKPVIDPLTELECTDVIIKANAASPDGFSTLTIFAENAAGEWTSPGAGPDFDLNNPEQPHSGLIAIKTIAPLGQSQSLPFEAPAPVEMASVSGLRYWMNLIASGEHRVLVTGTKSNGAAGSFWMNVPDTFISNNTGEWQQIYLIFPVNNLTHITKTSIVCSTDGLEYFIDDVELVQGGGNVSSSTVDQAYVDQKAAEAQANAIAEAAAMDNDLASAIDLLEEEVLVHEARLDAFDALQNLSPVTVAASRLLTAADKGGKLFITAAVTLTYPAAGLGSSFEFNVVCSEAGQLTMADEAATPGDHLDAPDGKILEARKMAHCFVRPDNGQLTLQGSWTS